MPTYEYQCKHCGRHHEAVQSFHDPALTTCPHCGGELRKVFGAVGIVFKGSGFYKTDSRNGSTGTKHSEKSGDSATGSGESATGSAETKSSDSSASSASTSDSKPSSTPAAASTGASSST